VKIAAILLAIAGALLIAFFGYLFWVGSFGQINVRVPSYGWHVLIAFLAAAIGALTAIWRTGAGALLMAVSVGSLLLLDYKMIHWVTHKAVERDVGISNVLTNAAAAFALPVILIAIAALLAWRRSVSQSRG